MRMAATAAAYNRLQHAGSASGVGVGGIGGSGALGHHTQLARSLERILEEAHYSGELILTNRKLKDFPKTGTKFNLEDTVIADLSRNRFCELPEEITTFAFLETLLLYHNTIRSVPESVKHLTSLTYLDLRSNQLSALPRDICFLPLQVLLVSNNRLTALPDELGRMDRLTDLDASYNQLTALPARIGELRSLRSFSLRSNQLMYLPRELTCLTLVALDVSNNRIASLPLEIRQMSTLVEFNLEHNPLTSPPASLCIRGLVHVFKFLETQATKEEKGTRAGGNYDGYTTLRRAPRHNANGAGGAASESNRVPRHHVDSGYSTCDGIDKRWSHDMPSVKSLNESPSRRLPSTPPPSVGSLSVELMDASLTSSTSTIVDESLTLTASSGGAAVVQPLMPESNGGGMSPMKRKEDPLQPPITLHHHINYAQSSSSNGSSPEQEDLLIDAQQPLQNGGKLDEKLNKNLGNIQTYREYKEALKQQRNLEISSVYKIKGQKTLYDMGDASNALNMSGLPLEGGEYEVRFNGSATLPKSIMKNGGTNGTNGLNGSGASLNGGGDECLVIPKKPIQKVIPSRNTELMSSLAAVASKPQAGDVEKLTANGGVDCLGYVKPSSPMKSANGGGVSGAASAGGGILTNNNKYNTVGGGGLKSPVSSTTKFGTAKTQRTVTWNHDIPAEKLSFTMRREFDRQREETELMTQLRSIIETRLKMTLPEDIASALTDGVILCHLANYVRPRSVASIHVPSPGVSKLTMARCRRNVDNFLEACRRIGVDEELICSSEDVVPPSDNGACDKSTLNNNLNGTDNLPQLLQQQQQHQPTPLDIEKRPTLPNPPAVLKTVSALIAMDFNPHHQNIRNLQQQNELHIKLQQRQLLHKQIDYQRRCLHSEEQLQLHLEQEQKQQLQLTATGTKEQMQQMDFVKSTLRYNAQCQFESVPVANGNGHGDSDGENDLRGGGNGVCEADDVGVTNGFATALEQEPQSSNVGNLLRHAKLKTFQKIKFSLITSHGNSGSSSNSGGSNNATNCNNNQYSTLQTIVETENDIVGGGGTAGVYHLINERPKCEELLQLSVNTMATEHGAEKTGGPCNDKYKLLPSMERKAEENKKSAAAIVSKRIEFFEHSSTNGGANNGSAITATAIAANGGTSKTKSKANNSIFSIYRVAVGDVGTSEKVLKNALAEKEAGSSSSLLKHDSHVLTVILSCVFMVTFLLLVFFPLPG